MSSISTNNKSHINFLLFYIFYNFLWINHISWRF